MKNRHFLFSIPILMLMLINGTSCSSLHSENISAIKHTGLNDTIVIFDRVVPHPTIAFDYEGEKLSVDWGDGVINQSTSHTYNTVETTTVITISGDITSISFCNDEGVPYSRDNDCIYTVAFANSIDHLTSHSFTLKNLHYVFISRFITSIETDTFCSYNDSTVFCCGVSKKLAGWADSWHSNLLGQDVVVWESNISADDNFLYVLIIRERHLMASVIKNIKYDAESVVIPDVVRVGSEDYLVTTIFDYAFMDNSFTNIKISHNVNYIASYAFYNCTKLEKVEFPSNSSLVSIGNRAFSHCSQLKDFVLPSTISGIGDEAFKNCSSLKSLVIPENLYFIGSRCFEDCNSLETIDVSGYHQANDIAICNVSPFTVAPTLPLTFIYSKDVTIDDYIIRNWPGPIDNLIIWQAI